MTKTKDRKQLKKKKNEDLNKHGRTAKQIARKLKRKEKRAK